LALFEPRLAQVQISVAEVEGEQRRRELRFMVEATLRLDPTPEQVMFDTVLHFASGQIDVAGAANA
jgi:type VI secretion system protein ImpF